MGFAPGTLVPPEQVELVIADISGYTAYLTNAELDHANNVLQDLLETIQEHLPPLRVVEVEGDAIFAWAPRGGLDGSMVLDAVRATFLAFRRRVRTIHLATACRCGACRRIDTLDLKFIVHSGTAVRQRTRTGEILTGTDVITAHRLLKNHVGERFATRAYAVLTDQAIDVLGIDPVAVGAVDHAESYEHLGKVHCWVWDLRSVWQREEERAPLVFPTERAPWVVTIQSSAPPQLVWDFMTTPAKRLLWQDQFSRIDQLSPTRGIGTVNHCLHGRSILIEEILDWHPFHSYAVQVRARLFGPMETSFTLEAHDGGTRLSAIGRRPRNPVRRLMLRLAQAMVAGSLRRDLQRLVRLVETAAKDAGIAGTAPRDDREVPLLIPIEDASPDQP